MQQQQSFIIAAVMVPTTVCCLLGFFTIFLCQNASALSSSSSSTAAAVINTNNNNNNNPSVLSFDVIVIGGGSAGLTAAKLAAITLKSSCALIERDRLGGDCTWSGCVPSKSFLALSIARQEGRTAFSELQQQIQTKIQTIYQQDDSAEVLQKSNIDVFAGNAVFLDAKTVQVTMKNNDNDNKEDTGIQQPTKTTTTTLLLQAKEGIIVCTGAGPRIPDESEIKGLAGVKYYTSETIWTKLMELPKQLTIIGGGPVGCELAQAFQRLGSKVTIIAEKLLPKEDPAVNEVIQKVFTKEGITICKARPKSVVETTTTTSSSSSSLNSQHTVTCQSSDGTTTTTTTVTGDALLIAVGRNPRVQGMGFENAGIEVTKGAIVVNDCLQTTCKGIYAAGDCTGGRQFTHYAGYQGAIAARNILLPFTDPGVLKNSIPSVTFLKPEVASIGMSVAEAEKEFGSKDAIVVKKEMLTHADRAVCDGSADDGFLQIIYQKRGKQQILGATIVAPGAGEIISEIAVAMKTKLSFPDLATVMHPYPTYSFQLQLMAAEAYYEKTLRLKWLYNILKKLGL